MIQIQFVHEHIETIDHLVSGCSVWTAKEYKDWYDNTEHWKIYLYSSPYAEILSKHHIVPVIEGHKITTLCDFIIPTERHKN